MADDLSLKPEELVFRISRFIVPLLDDSPLIANARERGRHAGLRPAGEDVWLVASGADLPLLIEAMHKTYWLASAQRDPQMMGHAAHLQMQTESNRVYYDRGWREGLYTPWALLADRAMVVHQGKTHLRLLLRPETEPYLLTFGQAVCQNLFARPGAGVNGPVTCGKCLGIIKQEPERYPLTETIKEI